MESDDKEMILIELPVTYKVDKRYDERDGYGQYNNESGPPSAQEKSTTRVTNTKA
jgi:hypothetical protein